MWGAPDAATIGFKSHPDRLGLPKTAAVFAELPDQFPDAARTDARLAAVQPMNLFGLDLSDNEPG